MDKKIKLLLLSLNKKGQDIDLITKTRYSKEYDNVYSIYILQKWYKGTKTNKKTNQEEEYDYCTTTEFKNKINLIKYLVVLKEKLDE